MTAANPYFALERIERIERIEPSHRPDGWAPLAGLTEAAVLRARAERVRAALGPGPLRAAGSVDFLGLSARVLSPVLAALTTVGAAPVLSLTDTWWRAAASGPMRLAVAEPELSTSLADAVLVPVVVPLVGAYATTFALSRKVLWGDVGSALNGAALALGRGRADFRRGTCCLLYRLGGQRCGDCVLRARD